MKKRRFSQINANWINNYECPHFAKYLVGAGFACPNASTDIPVNVFGRANPAPTLDTH